MNNIAAKNPKEVYLVIPIITSNAFVNKPISDESPTPSNIYFN
jgi:hypothetical protein